jgi:hypothetical protein
MTFQRFSENKFTVSLSGGRKYAFRVGDITKLMIWTPGCEVELSESDDRVFPIRISRVDFPDEEVLARDPSSSRGLPRDL